MKESNGWHTAESVLVRLVLLILTLIGLAKVLIIELKSLLDYLG